LRFLRVLCGDIRAHRHLVVRCGCAVLHLVNVRFVSACVSPSPVTHSRSYEGLARFNQRYERAFVLQAREDVRCVLAAGSHCGVRACRPTRCERCVAAGGSGSRSCCWTASASS
jgi:hypothetical protein